MQSEVIPFVTVLAAMLALPLSLYVLHKARRIHLLLHQLKDESHHNSAMLFRQMEALQGLYVELDLRNGLPATRGWAASPDFLLELVRHARMHTPQCVIECSSGASTLVLARCMQLNGGGKVFSLEHDPYYAQQTRRQLQRHGLSDWAEVIDAPLREHAFGGDKWPWYALQGIAPDLAVDMLVIDGPPKATRALARYPAGPALFGRLAPGASVFLDDAARPDEQAIVRRWQAEHPELILSMLPCEKGCALLVRRAV
jgi:predicted O-methyltransferase YrrM